MSLWKNSAFSVSINRSINGNGWRCLIIALLVLGVFFRFVNLESKIYGLDETYTSLRISGYTEAEQVQDFSNRPKITIKDIQKYQGTNSERNVIGTVKGLAVEEPQHPPLYYVMARFWAQWLGNSVAVTRSLPALISLLAFPCLYWLCLELFESPLTGWVAVALLAVSPFHVVYAQEARQYSLWTVTILLSSAALLRAMRLKTKISWSIYAVSLATGFYTFLLSGLVAAGHGIYVAVIEKFRFSHNFISYLVASGLGTLAFSPWGWAVINNWERVKHTTNWDANKQFSKQYLGDLLRGWIRQPGRVFFDLNLSPHDPFTYRIPQFLFTGVCLVLVAASLSCLYRTTQKRNWLFVFTLIGGTGLGLILQDLILKGQEGQASAIPRYVIPCYLGFQIAVAHLFVYKLTCGSLNLRQQKLWKSALAVIVSGGVISCTLSSQAEVWWNKGGPDYLRDNLSAARLINQSNHPLLISDSNCWGLMFISHLIDPEVQLIGKPNCFSCSLNNQLELTPIIPDTYSGFSDIFLFPKPSAVLLDKIGKQQIYKAKPILFSPFRESVIWRLEKRSSQETAIPE